jgi:hypothetical protein
MESRCDGGIEAKVAGGGARNERQIPTQVVPWFCRGLLLQSANLNHCICGALHFEKQKNAIQVGGGVGFAVSCSWPQ